MPVNSIGVARGRGLSHVDEPCQLTGDELHADGEAPQTVGGPQRPSAAATAAASALGAEPAVDTFAQQCEIVRLRQERDVAIAEEQAQLRRARDAAVAEAEHTRAQLGLLQREHCELREAHAVAVLKAEQQAERSAAQLASKARALERLQVAHAALTETDTGKALRIEALETKVAVLLDCYRVLEGEQQAARHRVGPAALAQPIQLRLPAAAAPESADGRCPGGLDAEGSWAPVTGDEQAQVAANHSPGEAAAVERFAGSHSHLGLALRCAELQWRLGQQRCLTATARQEAAAAEEQAVGLRLLLARQQAAGGCTAQLEERLGAARRQLEEAQRLGAELQQQVAQKDAALCIALQEKQQLQQDLSLMLAARDSLAALKASLQWAAGAVPLTA